MSRSFKLLTVLLTFLFFSTSTFGQDPAESLEEVTPAPLPEYPEPAASEFPAKKLEQGRYMVSLLGCGSCHTDGALTGEPDAERMLAGSRVGIAWTNPMANEHPGVVFPPNLTPHEETGLGDWSVDDIVGMLTSGAARHGRQSVIVMPWQTYTQLKAEDAEAIAMYLKSLAPIEHQVPENVRRGKKTKHPYVHFGIYRSQQ